MTIYWAARLLAFSTGFISLSQEILWVRLVGFSIGNIPITFSLVLGLYLLGIAIGANFGKRYCTDRYDLLSVSGTLLLIAGICDILFPFAVAMAFAVKSAIAPALGIMVIIPCIIITSLIKSMIFPIAHHLGASSQEDKIGSSVSKVYFANIMGSTLGPLVTGFFLLNKVSLQTAMMTIAILTIFLGFYYKFYDKKLSIRITMSACLLVSLAFFIPQNLTSILASNNLNPENGDSSVKQLIENRYGIIHVQANKEQGDSVWGGNVYDGRVNIDLVKNSNLIHRVYGLSTLKPSFERILVIGLSAGSWTRVLQAFPGAKKIDVVELNPAYLDVIKKYPEISPLLSDERTTIIFDDGRRWLKRNPSLKYDLIVMNTTFHWRAYVTYLLSLEFMQLLKNHMNQEAVLAFNTTGLLDCFTTAHQVFKDVYQLSNFAVVGDAINIPDTELSLARLSALNLDGQLLFHADQQTDKDKAMETIIGKFIPYAQLQKEHPNWPFMVITDQNLLSEYRHSGKMEGIRELLPIF
jgi:spermidine synthase